MLRKGIDPQSFIDLVIHGWLADVQSSQLRQNSVYTHMQSQSAARNEIGFSGSLQLLLMSLAGSFNENKATLQLTFAV